MPCGNLFKGRAVWIVLLGATFVCCVLIIYNVSLYFETRCTSQPSWSNRYRIKSARLGSENCRTACTTKECIEIANFILNNMNRSADPCKDFSTFACGNYGEQFERDSDHSAHLTLEDDIYMVIRDIIETSNETQIAGSAAQKLKIVYNSCINSKTSYASAIRSMRQFLNQMGIPNWPHLDSNFSFRNTTFEEITGKLILYQEDIFLRFVDKNRKERSLQEQDLCNITVESQNPTYHDNWKARDLEKYVMIILRYTGMNKWYNIHRTLEEFMDVDNRLHNLYKENYRIKEVWKAEETTEAAYINCSQQNPSEIMLCRIWDSVVRNGGISTYVNKDLLKISSKHTYYIERLPSVLSSYNHRTLAHYIALRLFINNLKYMSFSIRRNLVDLNKSFLISKEEYTVELDHWKYCVSWVAQNMKSPLGLMYVSRLWGKDEADQLDDIVNEYRQTIIHSIQEQDWIDGNDKQSLLQEVKEQENSISAVIEFFRNKEKINNNYRQFHPTRKDFFCNVMKHKKSQFIEKYFMTAAELKAQGFNSFIVGAYAGETIDISFGILLPPFFKNGYPKLFNVAHFGQIIGHELGHNIIIFLHPLNKETGTTNATRQHQAKKMECFIDQYSSYELVSIKQNIKGDVTVSEDMCDNMSTKVTEKIAEQLIRGMEAENFTLPGLPYSPEQLFYISNAQVWCDIQSIETQNEKFKWDQHSPYKYRIIGPLQNSKRFSEVFHCPSTSYMNPEKKCVVFD